MVKSLEGSELLLWICVCARVVEHTKTNAHVSRPGRALIIVSVSLRRTRPALMVGLEKKIYRKGIRHWLSLALTANYISN